MNTLRSLVVLFALVFAGPALADYELYFGTGIGRSDSGSDPAALQSTLARQGYDITAATVDAEDGGGRILVGLQFTDTWAVELGFVDLGKVRAEVAGVVPSSQVAQFTQDVADALPVMPRGLTLAAVARKTMTEMGWEPGGITDNLSFALKLGLIDSDAKRSVSGVSGHNEVNADPYYGLNVGIDFSDNWRGIIGYEIFNLADSTEYWSLGLEVRFANKGK
ncbi:MAG: outer membrane beta-barrel protein [Gammaproteobacteria bacterium]|nr:outer membrane beta-barrel protein [Gammaproteobacteria bacterium]